MESISVEADDCTCIICTYAKWFSTQFVIRCNFISLVQWRAGYLMAFLNDVHLIRNNFYQNFDELKMNSEWTFIFRVLFQHLHLLIPCVLCAKHLKKCLNDVSCWLTSFMMSNSYRRWMLVHVTESKISLSFYLFTLYTVCIHFYNSPLLIYSCRLSYGNHQKMRISFKSLNDEHRLRDGRDWFVNHILCKLWFMSHLYINS